MLKWLLMLVFFSMFCHSTWMPDWLSGSWWIKQHRKILRTLCSFDLGYPVKRIFYFFLFGDKTLRPFFFVSLLVILLQNYTAIHFAVNNHQDSNSVCKFWFAVLGIFYRSICSGNYCSLQNVVSFQRLRFLSHLCTAFQPPDSTCEHFLPTGLG